MYKFAWYYINHNMVIGSSDFLLSGATNIPHSNGYDQWIAGCIYFVNILNYSQKTYSNF